MKQTIRLMTACCLLFISGCTQNSCVKTYHLKYLPQAKIAVDEQLDELAWNTSSVADDFSFPWERGVAPVTEFRALYNDNYFYFSFKSYDDDIVFNDNNSGEMLIINEDRCELYFSRCYNLKKYYCVEIDSRGRRLDYAASYHRKFDFTWSFPEITTAASLFNDGYIIEGAILWCTFKQLNILPKTLDEKLRIGLYRAQVSTGQKSEDEYQWISWVDPKVEQPDFHIPQTFGCLGLREIPSSW